MIDIIPDEVTHLPEEGSARRSNTHYDWTIVHATGGGHVQIRSSVTDPLQIAEVAAIGGGTVGVTFCPGKCGPSLYGHSWKRDLDADLDVIERWGARVVLTLVETFELEALEVAALGERVQSRGMHWMHLPIVDVSVPSAAFEDQWQEELPNLLGILERGERILVHCKGGLGRAGTVAALLLVEAGEEPGAAIRHIRKVRPGAVQTRGQVSYVMRYRRRGKQR